jgi:hypothetical protein
MPNFTESQNADIHPFSSPFTFCKYFFAQNMNSVSLQVVRKYQSSGLHGCDAVLLVSASWHLFVPKSQVDQESSFLVLLTLENEPLPSHWVISQMTETDVQTSQ